MKLAKISLIASAIGFFGFGLAFFIAPELLERSGLAFTDPAALIEIRAFYGGLQFGLTMFFIIALKNNWIVQGLSAQITIVGFVVLIRIAASIMSNFHGNFMTYFYLAADTSLLILGLIAISLYKKKTQGGLS
jgi:hypothetical protein